MTASLKTCVWLMDTNDKKRDLTSELSSDHYVYIMDHVCVHTPTKTETRRGSGVLLNCSHLSGLWKRNPETKEASWGSKPAGRGWITYYLEHWLKGKGVCLTLSCDRPASSFCLSWKAVSVFLAYCKSQVLYNTDKHHHCNIIYNNQKQRVWFCAGTLAWSPGFHCQYSKWQWWGLQTKANWLNMTKMPRAGN